MPHPATIRAEADRLARAFEAAGAEPVEVDVLQPAETLLDLYGEDIRSRAYVTRDPHRGEMMLRPDFTVPVTLRHLANGADEARYSYVGAVFRVQELGSDRASEYLQAGYERFGGDDPAVADAEVFGLFARLLAPLGLRAATGDMGLVTAAIEGLSTTPARKAALLRHRWRPRRFRALLDRFAGRSEPKPRPAPAPGDAPEIGLRTAADVADRHAFFTADAATPPLSAVEMELLDDLLSIRETAPNALSHLRDLAVDMSAIQGAVDRLARRFDALDAGGQPVDALEFEPNFGRTTLEYYDGFVFGFTIAGRRDLPPVATGGRYDALTRVLSGGREVPAVGGVIRPALVADQEAAA
ncbi:MAG: ATP phosphoribosyltransferase regulatory subunit [Pseudomonadota bacterium]